MSYLYYSIQKGNRKPIKIGNYNVYYKRSINCLTTALTLPTDEVEEQIKIAGGFQKGWCFTAV